MKVCFKELLHGVHVITKERENDPGKKKTGAEWIFLYLVSFQASFCSLKKTGVRAAISPLTESRSLN